MVTPHIRKVYDYAFAQIERAERKLKEDSNISRLSLPAHASCAASLANKPAFIPANHSKNISTFTNWLLPPQGFYTSCLSQASCTWSQRTAIGTECSCACNFVTSTNHWFGGTKGQFPDM